MYDALDNGSFTVKFIGTSTPMNVLFAIEESETLGGVRSIVMFTIAEALKPEYPQPMGVFVDSQLAL